MTRAAETALGEVLTVIHHAVDATGCRWWLEGGWGVDALVGHQTRAHRDLDLDVDVAFVDEVLTALHELGYEIETDWRPNRVELAAPRRGWVDVHPVVVEEDGSARQAGLEGGWHHFPRSYFTMGSLGGVPVPCVSLQAQRAFHAGYELREVDVHDLELLDRLHRQHGSVHRPSGSRLPSGRLGRR